MAARVRRLLTSLRRTGTVLGAAALAGVLLAGYVTGVPPLPTGVAAAAAVLVAWAAELHRPRLVLSIIEDLPGLVVAAAVATVVVVLTADAVLAFGPLVLACLVLAQATVSGVIQVLRRTHRLRRRVLVVGTGRTARRLALTLQARPELGLEPVGFVATGEDPVLAQARGLPLPLLGPVAALPRAMSEARVDAVVVALAGPPGDQETAAVEGLLASAADVYAVPAWFPPVRAHAPHRRELVSGVPVVRAHRRGTWLPVRAAKRLVEVVVALVTLAVLLPLGALLAVLVRVETGGVLVRRPVLDELGRSLPEPRFRTRRARSVERPGTTFSVAVPGRTGLVGLLLRSTHLDALPAVVTAVLRRLRYAGRVSVDLGSATAARPDQAQVDAGQLAG